MHESLIDPDIPSKREEREHDIREKELEVSELEDQLETLKDKLQGALNELDDLRDTCS
jgi:molecular chaperone GrpE (heat shock protein)